MLMNNFAYDNLMHDIKSVNDINKLTGKGISLEETDTLIDQLKFKARPSNMITIVTGMFTLLITGVINFMAMSHTVLVENYSYDHGKQMGKIYNIKPYHLLSMIWNSSTQNMILMKGLFLVILIFILVLCFYMYNEDRKQEKYEHQLDALYAYKRLLIRHGRK